ncbi:MAG TPA: hypothetical protein VFQ85_16485 [Mycobacteriales bacterium]|jgi:hypothetical protein|nr:hypothetical protein [Mycobacteriales bacterium]
MTRLLAAAGLALALALPATAAEPPSPGGVCTGPVDFSCHPPCHEDELDCGMLVCLVYVGQGCLVGNY